MANIMTDTPIDSAPDSTTDKTFEDRPRRDIRSYVLRGGCMTASQQRAYSDLWPAYGLEPAAGQIDLQQVFGRQAPTVLEIGFGMGDSLVTMASAAPELNFIGVEVHKPGVGRLLHLAESAQLENLRVYCADAVDVLKDCVPDNSLHRVQLFFPDPWHKKRHHKRRIMQASFIEMVLRKLQSGGQFHAATDWENYAEHMLEELGETGGMVNVAGAGNYAEKPDYRPPTKFERRGERLGHGVWDLVFSKQ